MVYNGNIVHIYIYIYIYIEREREIDIYIHELQDTQYIIWYIIYTCTSDWIRKDIPPARSAEPGRKQSVLVSTIKVSVGRIGQCGVPCQRLKKRHFRNHWELLPPPSAKFHCASFHVDIMRNSNYEVYAISCLLYYVNWALISHNNARANEHDALTNPQKYVWPSERKRERERES